MNDQDLDDLMRREADRAPFGDGDDLRRGRARLRRHRAVVGTGGTGLAAVAIAAVGMALPGAQQSGELDDPAVVTTYDADGRVHVTFDRFADVESVEHRLEKLGIPTEADLVPLDKECRQPRFPHAPGAGGAVLFRFADPDAVQDIGVERPFTVVVDRDRLEPGQTVVIEAGTLSSEPADGSGHAKWAAISVADGPVKPCVLVDDEDDAPPPEAYGPR